MSLGGESFVEQSRQEAGGAIIVWAALWLSSGPQKPAKNPGLVGLGIVVLVLVASAVCGLLFIHGGLSTNNELYVSIPVEYMRSSGSTIGALLGFFLLVALFEEGLFRGLFCPCLADYLRERGKSQPVLRAAVISALIFAAMHLMGQGGFRIFGFTMLQAVFKFFEATFFGLTMTALSRATNRLWPCVAVHTLYNLISMGPMAVRYGVIPASYLNNITSDLLAMTACMIILAPAAYLACRFLGKLR